MKKARKIIDTCKRCARTQTKECTHAHSLAGVRTPSVPVKQTAGAEILPGKSS